MKRPLAFAISFIVILYGCDPWSSIVNRVKPIFWHGVVIKKYKEQSCFGTIIIKQQLELDTLKDLCYCVTQGQGIWDYAQPNDSLYKYPGLLEFRIVRDGQQKLFKYPFCFE
jgi:hypothetical protein